MFETLLSKLPDNQATREYTRLGDVAGVIAALGLDLLPPGSSFEDISQYSRQFAAPEFNGFYRRSGSGLPNCVTTRAA